MEKYCVGRQRLRYCEFISQWRSIVWVSSYISQWSSHMTLAVSCRLQNGVGGGGAMGSMGQAFITLNKNHMQVLERKG